MSKIIAFCRLCVSSRQEYKSLYDENGQGTYIYEITLRYFDPMLLSADNEQSSTVICSECWKHINDFYGFQESVLKAQSNLQDSLSQDIKQIVLQIKEENELSFESLGVSFESQINQDLKDENDGIDFETDNVKDPVVFTSDEDDDKPLILQKAKLKKFKAEERKKNNLNSRPKKCSSRSKLQCYKETLKSKKSKPPLSETLSDVSQKEEQNESKNDPNMTDAAGKPKKTSRDKTKEFDAFIAEWKQELECASCTATVANFEQLREHFQSEHPNETCFAKCCERKFSKRVFLFEHLKLHINPAAYKCDICGKCNSNSRNLAKHIHERHTEEGKRRSFECDICQKKFTSKFTLRRHLELHENARDHICRQCGKGFATEQRRKVHEHMVHNDDRVCDQCGKRVRGLYALKQHLQEHKGVKKRTYPCDQCGTQYNSSASLKRHKEQIHHDGSTAYICRECGKIFNSQSSLMRHKKIVHLMERKYKCCICDKAFKFPLDIREHMASHTGVDLYECPHCPKTFKVRSNMHHHRKRVHPKEWLEARVSKLPMKKVDINLVSNEIII